MLICVSERNVYKCVMAIDGLTILSLCGDLGAVGFGATFAPLTVDGWVRLQLLGVFMG